ncbi:restriction endonuclease subunit S [Chromohalobacter sp. 11-W]|uniref:restriction endonuclease subunit S n=1 Tax=Chromohalobacter sp. 11-W TaxID=2994061 RepID=UPI002468369C|nr:restriction endonuclease subunit S [Chromohalobacter sp. 11-W]
MSNECTLGEIVYPVADKVEGVKDPSLNYVGLEHLCSGSGYLKGCAASSTSISTNSIFRAGDVIFGKLRPNLRKSVLAPFDGYCSTDLLVLRAVEGVLPEYAARVFQSEHVFRYAEKTAVGTKMPRTSWAQLKKLNIFVPHFSEQKTIAKILDILDTQIRQTEAIIAKLQQVKQGLLHDLLTRGIDASGQLRPPREQAPELYKDSPLGWIPKDWGTPTINDVVESLSDGPFGSNLKTEHYVELEGVRVVRLQNISVGKYDDTDRAFISFKHADSFFRNKVIPGDLLVASLGDQNHPVGRACLYPKRLPNAINKADCFRVRAKEKCHNAFLMLALNGETSRKQVRGYEQGVTLKRINTSNLRKVVIPLPLKEEQLVIECRYRSIENKLAYFEGEVLKLKKQKAGLMDDLLTGRVRVTELIEQEKQAS